MADPVPEDAVAGTKRPRTKPPRVPTDRTKRIPFTDTDALREAVTAVERTLEQVPRPADVAGGVVPVLPADDEWQGGKRRWLPAASSDAMTLLRSAIWSEVPVEVASVFPTLAPELYHVFNVLTVERRLKRRGAEGLTFETTSWSGLVTDADWKLFSDPLVVLQVFDEKPPVILALFLPSPAHPTLLRETLRCGPAMFESSQKHIAPLSKRAGQDLPYPMYVEGFRRDSHAGSCEREMAYGYCAHTSVKTGHGSAKKGRSSHLPAAPEAEDADHDRIAAEHTARLSAGERVVAPAIAENRRRLAVVAQEAGWPGFLPGVPADIIPAFLTTSSLGYACPFHNDSAAHGVLETIAWCTPDGGPLKTLPGPEHRWCFGIGDAGVIFDITPHAGALCLLPGKGVWHATLPSATLESHFGYEGLGFALVTKSEVVGKRALDWYRVHGATAIRGSALPKP